MNRDNMRPKRPKRIGVSWSSMDRKWLAQISINNHRYRLGGFVRYEDAVAAREEAEKLHRMKPPAPTPASVITGLLLKWPRIAGGG